jgi:hypothetical protein
MSGHADMCERMRQVLMAVGRATGRASWFIVARTLHDERADAQAASRIATLAAPRRAQRDVAFARPPIAAALAFAIREAVRLEAEREHLPAAPGRANVVPMKPKPEAQVA